MFTALSRREKVLFLEAFFLHLWVGLMLKFVPFRWIPRLFSSPRSTAGSSQLPDIIMIKRAIDRANVVSPWKNRCLVSSLVARCMLRRRGIGSQLSLGVAKGADGKTIAHAWLKAGDFEIIEKRGDFTEFYLF